MVDAHVSRLWLDNDSFEIKYGSTGRLFNHEQQAFLWNQVMHHGKSNKDASAEHFQWSHKYEKWVTDKMVAAIIIFIQNCMSQALAGSPQAGHWQIVTQYVTDPHSLAPPPRGRTDPSRIMPNHRYRPGRNRNIARQFEFVNDQFDLLYRDVPDPWYFNREQQAFLYNWVVHRRSYIRDAIAHHFEWAQIYPNMPSNVLNGLLDKIEDDSAKAPRGSPEEAHWIYVKEIREDPATLIPPSYATHRQLEYAPAQTAQASLQPFPPHNPNAATVQQQQPEGSYFNQGAYGFPYQQQQAHASSASGYLNPGDPGYIAPQQQAHASSTSGFPIPGDYGYPDPYAPEQYVPSGHVESEWAPAAPLGQQRHPTDEELEDWEPPAQPRRQRHPPRSEPTGSSEGNRSLVLRSGHSRQRSLPPETESGFPGVEDYDDLSDEDESAVLHSLKNQISTIYHNAVKSVRTKDITDREPLREAIAKASRQVEDLQDQARREIATRKRKRSESERRTKDSEERSSRSDRSRQERERTGPASLPPGSLDGLEQEERDHLRRQEEAIFHEGFEKGDIEEATGRILELQARCKAESQKRLEMKRHAREPARERERSSRQERPSREGDRRRTTEGGRRPERSGKEREPPRDSHQKKKPRDGRR
ncbi:MAG: hypothetical protein Q9195_009172 [Heterodermia aff. obscurata]